jgi:hypothetical protein
MTFSIAYFLRLLFALGAGLAALFALSLTPPRFRKPLIALCTFLGGLYYALEFFLPVHRLPDHTKGNFLTPYLTTVATVSTVIITLSFGLGVISLLSIHLRAMSRRREGWGFSLTVVVSFFAMLIFGLLHKYAPKADIGFGITSKDVYDFLFSGGLAALDSAMFALIAFFIVSASYRAFRIRNVEASLLMISALIVMLGQVTLGTAITNGLPTTGLLANLRFENLAQYILLQINSPALRAVVFGIAVGFLATSLRLWLSLERGAFFDQEA